MSATFDAESDPKIRARIGPSIDRSFAQGKLFIACLSGLETPRVRGLRNRREAWRRRIAYRRPSQPRVDR
uniref:Uncharacterized protein n=1 Tax=uncultured marine virus TaxID=186617 RepID=A0A0F7L9P4_9VIRU|nr:hypothetical protein [uncultured marine virus]